MTCEELFQTYLNRLEEARLYLDQGLGEGAGEIFRELLDDIEKCDLSEAEKEELKARIEPEYRMAVTATGEPESVESGGETETETASAFFSEPEQAFEYGQALMDGQFWDEAVTQFKTAAAGGFDVMRCWEMCGDCAVRQERWDEAIRYYENIYADPNVDEDRRRQILLKITQCSQRQKKIEVTSSAQARSNPSKGNGAKPETPRKEAPAEFVSRSISSLDEHSVNQLIGGRATSYPLGRNTYLSGKERSYTVSNLLHVGASSVILEVQDDETGRKMAGQILSGPFSRDLKASTLAEWVMGQKMCNSRHVVKVLDLAQCADRFLIIREHPPFSLEDILAMGELLSVPLAVFLAHQILEGIGDIHLHMGRDEQIRKIYHLDLRPSRVLLYDRPALVKICNAGLWGELVRSNPKETSLKQLPLAFLAYRASEQFRPYLARKRPPFFTDIYLFGALFYEMLTGNPAFSGSSYEEYEIQHCEQYPTPPKVWRSEIPDELNQIIMKCLDSDPMKRWRSATQVTLILEKSFSTYVSREMEKPYRELIGRLSRD